MQGVYKRPIAHPADQWGAAADRCMNVGVLCRQISHIRVFCEVQKLKVAMNTSAWMLIASLPKTSTMWASPN